MNVTSPTEPLWKLERVNENTFKTDKIIEGLKVFFGGLFLGQALSAASQTVPSHLQLTHMASHFLRMGKKAPIFYHVEKVFDSKKFSIRIVKAVQSNIVVFSTTVTFHEKENNGINHQWIQMPDVGSPDLYPMINTNSSLKHGIPFLNDLSLFSEEFDIRPCIPLKSFLFKESWTKAELLWIRTLKKIKPTDAFHHTYIAAFISDMCITNVPLRQDISSWKNSQVFRLSLNQNMSFHASFQTDEWLLMERFSPVAGNGLGLVEGKIWTANGRLVASFSQETLLRTQL